MNYPFEFNELLLTDYVLDQLGFTEYHDGAGDFGDRRLDLGLETRYEIKCVDAKSDINDGYGYYMETKPKIEPGHFCTEDFGIRLYFLHDMYEDILLNRTSSELDMFIEKCNKSNAGPYLSSYILNKFKK